MLILAPHLTPSYTPVVSSYNLSHTWMKNTVQGSSTMPSLQCAPLPEAYDRVTYQ